MDNNIYVFQQHDNIGNQIGEEILRVTNVYPVFKRLELDISYNKVVPVRFDTRQANEMYSNYVNRASNSIIEYTVEAYRRLANTLWHGKIESFRGFSIEEIIDGQFRLLFMKSNEDLIFLHYLYLNEGNNFSVYIPDDIPDINRHRNSFNHNNMEYYAINTYEPFLEYGTSNMLDINIDLNEPFFRSFEIAFRLKNNYEEQKINICNNPFSKDTFKYYIFRNNIVITQYSKESLTVMQPDIKDNLGF